ncbi:MAG: ABC transporter permease [Candidatus Acidiferrales bacterium]
MQNFLQDIRYAIRSLLKSPGFLAVVVLSLALGMAANTTIFSVLNAVLYRPMPYEHPEKLVVIWETSQGHPDSRQAPPIAELVDWQKQNHVFDDIALTSFTESADLSGLGEPEPIRTQSVTPNFFKLLGVKPILGRIFFADEMQDKAQTVVISNSFWASHFNRDPEVLGKTFNLEGVVSTVVGVMPAGFAPFYGGRIDLWQPINPESSRYSARMDHWLMPVARLKSGVTLAQAQVEMDLIARRLEEAYPATNKGVGKRLRPLHEELYGWAGQTLYPLFGAVAFVLLIACANVANLLQSRAETRRKEYALRLALGSGRRRLIQQLLTESGLLALFGGFVGVLLTFVGITLFRKLAEDFPNIESIRVDGRVLVFTLGVSFVTAILFGLAPSIQASRANLNLVLREGERRMASSTRRLARHALVVTEVALAMVLLVGAGLMINTLVRLQRVNPGFDSSHVLTMRIQLPEGGKYLERLPGGDMEKTLPSVNAFYQELLEKVSALPGVESSGIISGLPLRGGAGMYSFSIVGHTPPSPENRPIAGYDEVSPGLFDALKIPLKRGRNLDEHDSQSAPWVVVINETFARRFFPNEDPIGQQVLFRYDPYPVDEERPRQIVGVVGDVKHFGLGEEAPPAAYSSYLQQPAVFPGGSALGHLQEDLVLRTAPGFSGANSNLALVVTKAVAGIDPDQPVTHIMTMDQVLAESIGDWRFYMRLLGIFAGIAVLLAAVGIYGVMSYSVNERTHEFGVRVALGALPGDVLGLVAGLGLKLAGIGVVIGILLALGLTRLITRFLFGVKPTDPVTYAAVAIALVFVALVGCYIPARRAMRVDPMVALRYE